MVGGLGNVIPIPICVDTNNQHNQNLSDVFTATFRWQSQRQSESKDLHTDTITTDHGVVRSSDGTARSYHLRDDACFHLQKGKSTTVNM